MNKSIKRIILEYCIDNQNEVFAHISNIDMLSWYINIMNMTKDQVINARTFQTLYLNFYIDAAKWLNRRFNLTKKECRIYCNLSDNDFDDGCDENPKPLYKNKKIIKKHIRRIKIMHEYGWEINVNPDYSPLLM